MQLVSVLALSEALGDSEYLTLQTKKTAEGAALEVARPLLVVDILTSCFATLVLKLDPLGQKKVWDSFRVYASLSFAISVQQESSCLGP